MWLFRSGLFVLFFIGINIYTGIRVFVLIKYFFSSFKAFVFWPLYILLSFSFIWMMQIRLDWLRPLRQMAMNSLPALFYFFLGLLFLDVLRFLLQQLNLIDRSKVYSAAGTVIAVFFTLIVMIFGFFHARRIHTVHYAINLSQQYEASSLRITLVSDLHIGSTIGREWIAKVVDAINKTEPDIICIAGDIFDTNIENIHDLEGAAEELRRLSAPLGVYACQGNHDIDRLSLREAGNTLNEIAGQSFRSTDRIQAFLETANIEYLLDEVILVADRFYLAGRRDASNRGLAANGGRRERKTAAELSAGLDSSMPLIFLDHQPLDFPAIEEAGADLIFSGHTHKGQFFPGNIATWQIFKKAGAVHYGHWQGHSAQGIVTSGTGVWGPPVRIATKSEVVVVDVIFGE